MQAADNKRLMQGIFDELAKGNGRPFRDAMDEDFCWTITGTTSWSRRYAGKQAVLDELMRPLFARFADQYRNTAERIIAEDDYVVVQCRGSVMTKSGVRYDNDYCYVCRLAGGKLKELTEYFDTELVTRALGEPEPSGISLSEGDRAARPG